jgi:hypothetical protein
VSNEQPNALPRSVGKMSSLDGNGAGCSRGGDAEKYRQSWSRLADQIDRYNALMRDQRCVVQK